jgi:phosphoribosylformimino-5-aminoimidazole carboxamide ribotide isomerase
VSPKVFPDPPAIYPAIDLRGGRVVRLVRGAADAEIGYGDDPGASARRWVAAGAACLHVIDLGAALGEPDSTAAVLAVARGVDVPVQVGGGIRDRERVEELLAGGAGRVILGTRALREPAFLRQMVAAHGAERVVLAMDVAGGRVRVAGWTEESSLDLEGGMELAERSGVRHVLVTAIDRDGTLSGPDLELAGETLRLALARGLLVVAAGGIGALDDVRALLDLGSPALEGVVAGRALYEGTVDLGEAVKLAASRRTARRM